MNSRNARSCCAVKWRDGLRELAAGLTDLALFEALAALANAP
jgi:hypothetical protein